MRELEPLPTPGATRPDPLPLVDRHGFRTAADSEKVWAALRPTLLASFGTLRARVLARLLGCTQRKADRHFPMERGDHLAGFRIAAAEPPTELVLEGEHRFARYTLIFRISRREGITTVGAETRAAFLGAAGRAYRLLVIASGAHARTMRRILRRLRERAEVPRPSR